MDHLWTPWRMQYISEHKSYENCVFCVAAGLEDCLENLVVHRGEYTFAILNRYPYNNGHLMIVPYQHCDSLSVLAESTLNEMMLLTTTAIKILSELYHPQGFNVGMNLGTVAGAGIAEHLHMHVVPRWGGDASFMSVVGQTRVVPEDLSESYQRIKTAWQKLA